MSDYRTAYEALLPSGEPEEETYWDGFDETDCGREITIGAEDSATCDIPRTSKHDTHSGPCSLGGRATWQGGGYCAGDPLPVRNLHLDPDA